MICFKNDLYEKSPVFLGQHNSDSHKKILVGFNHSYRTLFPTNPYRLYSERKESSAKIVQVFYVFLIYFLCI